MDSTGVSSPESFRKTLDWIWQEYERLESENRTLKASSSNGQPTVDALRATSTVTVDSALDEICAPGYFLSPCPPPGRTSPEEERKRADSSPSVAEIAEIPGAVERAAPPCPYEAEAARKERLEALDVQQPSLFHNLDELKYCVKGYLKEKPVYRVESFYKTTGIFQFVARHRWFDTGTFVIIGLNALWIAVDTDHNKADMLLDAHPVFMTAEQLFCFFFTGELLVRFFAFEKKYNCLKDLWFVFDLFLVTMMILETWVLIIVMAATVRSSGGSGIGTVGVLKLAKMLRVVRMLRVARLMRSMPEFFILVKAISSASRAVFFTCAFLFVILYVYGIAFTLILRDTTVGDEMFSSVSVSIQTLFFQVVMGDGIADTMAAVLLESMLASVALGTCILIGSITLMNTLIGVLCEAIGAVAEKERMSIQISIVEATLRQILEEGDTDHDGSISKDEFATLIGSKTAVLALEDIGIDVVGLAETSDYFFEEHLECGASEFSKRLSFEDFMQLLLQLRGSNKATLKDMVDLRKHMHKIIRTMDKLSSDVRNLQGSQMRLPHGKTRPS
jgi:voltage-gated sodium channel